MCNYFIFDVIAFGNIQKSVNLVLVNGYYFLFNNLYNKIRVNFYNICELS